MKVLNLSYFQLIPFNKTYSHILSWFFSTKRLKIMYSNLSYLSKLKSDKNQKCTKRSFSLEFIEHTIGFVRLTLMPTTTKTARGIESALPSSAAILKQSALAIWPRKYFSNRKNGKYIDWPYNDFSSSQKIMKYKVII